MIALIILVWVLSGIAGYIFWETSKYDILSKDIPLVLFIGSSLGPLSWLVGFLLYGWKNPDKILFKKRK